MGATNSTDEIKMTLEHESHLDSMSDAGITNAFEATNSLMAEFPELKKSQAIGILKQWVELQQLKAMQ